MRIVKGSAFVFFIFLFCFSCFWPAQVFAADGTDKITYNRFNIVLVTDTSGSMKSTDINGLRYEAIGKFIALLAERGNRMGTVVFNGDVAFKQNVSVANGIAIKRDFLKNIENIPASGYTNIGKALATAIEMLDQDKNPDLPSIILLLSDGNTDLENNDELTESFEQKADAIQKSRDAGYQIYTVSLNADGTANSDELAQIAKATGGQFQEVKKASDLEDVFSMYYSLIFSSKMDKGDEKIFPSSGEITGTFQIPTVGVEEVNLVLSGQATDYSLTDPSSKQYPKTELSAFTYSSDTFNVVKMVDPLAGEWKYQVKGIPGDKIRINIVYNTDLSMGTDITPVKNVYLANDQITITAFLTEAGTPTRVDQYHGFSANLSILDGQGKTNSVNMTLGLAGFEYVLVPPQSGTYSVQVNITGQDYQLMSDSVQLNVGNEPPVFNQNIEETVLLWPFSDNQKMIDLTYGATDAQDDNLSYEVESSAFMDDEYELQGNILNMKSYSLTKGSYTIRAYDSEGAFCTFDVIVNTVNMTLLGIFLLGGGILITLVVIGLGLWMALNKRFMGSCYVTQFDDQGNYYEEAKREKGRGRIPLSAFNLKNTGFNTSKCYIQATGKNYVYLCTNVKVYCDGLFDKKFKIEGNGYGVTVSLDEQAQKGIRIKFISRLNNTSFSF